MMRLLRILACSSALLLLLAGALRAQVQCQGVNTDRLHSMVVDNAYKLEGGKVSQHTIIDTRAPESYKEGHIFSAINIPANALKASNPQLPKDPQASLILYGDATTLQSNREAFLELTRTGHENVFVYSEPFETWRLKGLPVVLRTRGKP